MEYVYNGEIFFSIHEGVYSRFQEYIKQYHFKTESGGIIVGTLVPSKKRVIATDITEPQAKDECLGFTYKRSEFGHQEIMDCLWENSNKTKTYIGEWHTHRQKIPQPSLTDIRNWGTISRRRQNSD